MPFSWLLQGYERKHPKYEVVEKELKQIFYTCKNANISQKMKHGSGCDCGVRLTACLELPPELTFSFPFFFLSGHFIHDGFLIGVAKQSFVDVVTQFTNK